MKEPLGLFLGFYVEGAIPTLFSPLSLATPLGFGQIPCNSTAGPWACGLQRSGLGPAESW